MVVNVLALGVNWRPCFTTIITDFAVVTSNINTVELVLVCKDFLIVVRASSSAHFIRHFSPACPLVFRTIKTAFAVVGFNSGVKYVWVHW